MDKMALCGRRDVLRLLLLFFLRIVSFEAATDTSLKREVTSSFLCNETASDKQVVHTSAVGPNDTLHYVFSTQGVPSVLVVRTNVTDQINVDCKNFFGNMTEMSRSIKFTHPHYAYAVMFNRLFEYNDTEDVANLDKLHPNTSWHIHDLHNITWEHLDVKDKDENTIKFTLAQDSEGLSFHENGSLSLQIRIEGKYHRDSLLPHLEYNANMTMFDLVLDNINSSFSQARFALEMTMVSQDGIPNTMDIRTTTYIDDEHSPGVFQMIDWTAKGQDQTWSGFFQFKPVCYLSSERTLNDATKAVFYHLFTPNWTFVNPPPSVAYAYFGSGMYEDKLSMTMTNISFGLSKDKFYTKSNYTVWTAAIGFGTPPADEVSIVIIVVLSVGLGLPIVLILFGGIGICIKRRRGSNVYEEITSNEPVVN